MWLQMLNDISDLLGDGLKDIRPPQDLPPDYRSWILVGVLVLLGILIVVLLRFSNRRPAKPFVPAEEPVIPWEKAFKLLGHLENSDLLAKGEIKEFYSRLSDILREYIEDRFAVRAPEMTTEEFLQSINGSTAVPTTHQEILKNFLISCDMVKFAKFAPGNDDARASLVLVRDFISQTKE